MPVISATDLKTLILVPEAVREKVLNLFGYSTNDYLLATADPTADDGTAASIPSVDTVTAAVLAALVAEGGGALAAYALVGTHQGYTSTQLNLSPTPVITAIAAAATSIVGTCTAPNGTAVHVYILNTDGSTSLIVNSSAVEVVGSVSSNAWSVACAHADNAQFIAGAVLIAVSIQSSKTPSLRATPVTVSA